MGHLAETSWHRVGNFRMAKVSAGILMYRRDGGETRVLLVHPGGPFFRSKDLGAWTIPKGEIEPGEDPLATARREFAEELGTAPAGPFVALGTIRQKGGKTVHAWASPGDLDVARIHSNTVSMTWPPRSGKTIDFPEVDRAQWFDLPAARVKINPAQVKFLDEFELLLSRTAEK
jgi:predicted NUDIX family NTP pyrophosphohydrolase